MVDFDRLVGRRPGPDLTDPLRLFESLDRKTSHTTLRPAQQAALGGIRANWKKRDLVLKMPTGTGKSTVGLLFLRSHMAERKRPGVYLCPTIQLAEQVLAEAERLGLTAYLYPSGEPHPHPECLRGEAVVVCTYDKMFNARSTFNRADVGMVPSAVVLDDAHAGVEEVRQQFTVHCAEDELRKALFAAIDRACVAYQPGYWQDIKEGSRDSVIELPYWLWVTVLGDVQDVFGAYSGHDALRFSWRYVRNVLRWCRCLAAADGVEIVPETLPVRMVPPFQASEHRLFMSATLADDSVLVRELGCAAEAALNPIVSGADARMGERMVLVPYLIGPELDRDWLMEWAAKESAQARTVVLCPSERRARGWEEHGALVVLGAEVSEAIEKLRRGEVEFAAFAQRYDGIDLPDDSCRILILDGMPTGQGITDRYDSARPGTHAGVRNRFAYRIEQGLGRAVRSGADYAVAVLSGPELAAFTSKTEVRELMGADIQAQLDLSYELATLAQSEGAPSDEAFDELVNQCLKRDPGWRSFYDRKVRAAVAGAMAPLGEVGVRIAEGERVAAGAAHDGDSVRAGETLSTLLNEHVPPDNLALRGRLLQSLANYTHAHNPAKAFEIQAKAFSLNHALLRPPAGVAVRPLAPGKADPARAVVDWLLTFSNPNGAIACLHEITAGLSFGVGVERLEQALADVADLIGAEGQRPEKELGEGQDNLLRWSGMSFVIEAKSGADYAVIPKKDAEQLLHSVEWCRAHNAGGDIVPILVAPVARLGDGVHLPQSARIVTPALLARLVGVLTEYVAGLVEYTKKGGEDTKEVWRLISGHRLDPKSLVATFTVAPTRRG